MRTKLAAALALVVFSVVLGATVLREPLAYAAAPIRSFIIANDSSQAVPVRDQNLDAGGNIKVHEQGTAAVHEQGTANVNLTNSSVPVTGTVSLSGGNMRVITVAQNETIAKRTAWLSGWFDTSDCKSIAAFVRTDGTTSYTDLASSLSMSVTGGRVGDALGDVPGIRPNDEGIWYFSTDGGMPYFSPKSELGITNVDFDNAHTIVAAYLICQH